MVRFPALPSESRQAAYGQMPTFRFAPKSAIVATARDTESGHSLPEEREAITSTNEHFVRLAEFSDGEPWCPQVCPARQELIRPGWLCTHHQNEAVSTDSLRTAGSSSYLEQQSQERSTACRTTRRLGRAVGSVQPDRRGAPVSCIWGGAGAPPHR